MERVIGSVTVMTGETSTGSVVVTVMGTVTETGSPISPPTGWVMTSSGVMVAVTVMMGVG
jgi:hypothetical protein